MARPSRDQMKVMSSVESCDAAHCIWTASPTVTSALVGARVILVASADANICSACLLWTLCKYHLCCRNALLVQASKLFIVKRLQNSFFFYSGTDTQSRTQQKMPCEIIHEILCAVGYGRSQPQNGATAVG